MLVNTLEQSGHIFTVEFDVEATLAIGQTDYAAIDSAVETMLNTHIGASSRLAGSQARSTDAITPRSPRTRTSISSR
jgi:hypothetical protein